MKKQKPNPLGRALSEAIFNNPNEIKVPWYRRILKQRSGVKRINRSKYTARHQGPQECTRRLRQMEARTT